MTFTLSTRGLLVALSLPMSFVFTSGCQLREPFDVTVVSAGATAKNIKSGYFKQTNTVKNAAGDDVTVNLSPGLEEIGRPEIASSDAAVTTVELEPLQIVKGGVGHVVFALLDPPPETEMELALFTWADNDDDDKLDLSTTEDSELARTIFRHDAEANKKAVLTFYNYVPNSGDPYYTATALTGPAENVIISEDTLKGWMAVLPGNVDKAPPAADSDEDGLTDPIETGLGTDLYSADTDFDGKDDPTEVGDPSAPTDTDGDGLIDAIESSLSDFDADGTMDELDAE